MAWKSFLSVEWERLPKSAFSKLPTSGFAAVFGELSGLCPGENRTAPNFFGGFAPPRAKFDLNEPDRPLHVFVIDRIFFDQPVSTWSENAPSTNLLRGIGACEEVSWMW
ncbi:MAG: hypothetical protein IOC35_08380 [Methylobacterium sp.]|jgi:hypothetical protein|nr:hypothetical protein [Methylobacterium sp.]